MAIELFLLPMEGTGARTDPYRGKYTYAPEVVRAGTIRYSRTSHGVALIEASQTYLNTVQADPDVTLLATAQTVNDVLTASQANAAKSVFESVGIPDQMINAGDTRRQAIRAVCGMFMLSQRFEGRFGEGFWQKAQQRGMSLSSTWANFPQVLKDEFIDVRDSFGWTNLGITNASTMRQILRIASNQFENTPMLIAGVQI